MRGSPRSRRAACWSSRRATSRWRRCAASPSAGASCEALVRRLAIVGRASEAFYDRKRGASRVQYRARAASVREGFAPPFRIAVRDNGRQYTRVVLEALDREQITLADVSDYLGV